jgi:phytoene dehydrogenase-like protein
MSNRYDALIIGGGHNGLVCAFYLAKAGMKVRVLERRDIVGGACVTEEFHPGFRNSTASYTVSLLRPQGDCRHEAGRSRLSRARTPDQQFLPVRRYLSQAGWRRRSHPRRIRALFAKDADAYPHYDAALEKVAQVLRDLALQCPPNVGGGLHAGRCGQAGLAAGEDGPGRPARPAQHLHPLGPRIPRSWFEDDHVKSAFGFDAVVGNFAGVSTPGSAYVLLHHVFGEVNGKLGAWGHSVGGMGAITQAMAKACALVGVEISLESPVDKVLVNNGKAAGVKLVGGELYAPIVAANVGPALLYRQLVDRSDLAPISPTPWTATRPVRARSA